MPQRVVDTYAELVAAHAEQARSGRDRRVNELRTRQGQRAAELAAQYALPADDMEWDEL